MIIAGITMKDQKEFSILEKDIISQLSCNIPRIRTPFLYKASIIVVTMTMLILPLIYVSLIIGVSYGIIFHAINSIAIFSNRGSVLYKLLIYITPFIAGGILIFFMIMPFFRKEPEQRKKIQLDRDKEPVIFTLVQQVCRCVRASMPVRIEIDNEINASARLSTGFFNIFSNKLILTIGMPLVAGLSAKQFAGVLAHEFGHFSQGFGMRFSYIIRGINYWFYKIVNGRDSVNAAIDQSIKEINSAIVLIFYVAKFCIFITSKILWLLMIAGTAISSYLLQQMEYDADKYEINLVGSEVFESTVIRLRTLVIAQKYAYDLLSESVNEQQVVDNLPQYIKVNADKIEKEIINDIRNELEKGKTFIFDTHPCDKDRVKRAYQEKSNGIFRLDGDATQLFSDFNDSAQKISYDYYKEIFPQNISSMNFVTVDAILKKNSVLTEVYTAYNRYFQGITSVICPFLYFLPKQGSVTIDDAKVLLHRSREYIEQNFDLIKDKSNEVCNIDDRISTLIQAESLLESGFSINPAEFDLQDPVLDKVMDKKNALKNEFHNKAKELYDFYIYFYNRLDAVWFLLCNDSYRAQITDGDRMYKQFNEVALVIEKLHSIYLIINMIREYAIKIMVIFKNTPDTITDQIKTVVQKDIDFIYSGLLELQKELADSAYPFEHHQKQLLLREYLMERIPQENEKINAFEITQAMIDKLNNFYMRCLGTLAYISESVEYQEGYKPLKYIEESKNE